MSLLDREGQGKKQKHATQAQAAAAVGTVMAHVEAEAADPEEPRVQGSSRPRLDQWVRRRWHYLLIVRFTLNMVAKGTHHRHPQIPGKLPLC